MERRQEKKERMELRKENSSGKSFEDMIAYVDENGNFSETPPETKKI